MRIAVASSGLGHVARGIETWALDTAEALHAYGAEVTLFAGGAVPEAKCPLVVLPAFRRGDARTRRLAEKSPAWTWRWQLKSAYGWEQLSFWWHLWPWLRRQKFSVLHVQDPMLAFWCRRFRRLGLLRTREIMAHGTEETPQFLAQFRWVQHLAPWHLEQAERVLRSGGGLEKDSEAGDQHAETSVSAAGARSRTGRDARQPYWEAIPNFVDTAVFTPDTPGDLRAELGLPGEAFVLGVVAAVKRHHKRVDYAIEEFSAYLQRNPQIASAYLLIAGARTEETDSLLRLANEKAPGRIKILLDLPRKKMPAFYRSLDVFALVSLFEMMPIALLEAMACGIPAIVNRHPVLQWIIGSETAGGQAAAGGMAVDMARPGALARCLAGLSGEQLVRYGHNARARAQQVFSKEIVISRYLDYYRRVLEA